MGRWRWLVLSLVGLLGLALAASMWLAASSSVASASGLDVTTIIVYEPAPTAPRCPSGDIVGTTPLCPYYYLPGGLTPTPDGNYRAVLAADGNEYRVYRGFSYGEIYLGAAVTVIGALLALAFLLRAGRGG